MGDGIGYILLSISFTIIRSNVIYKHFTFLVYVDLKLSQLNHHSIAPSKSAVIIFRVIFTSLKGSLKCFIFSFSALIYYSRSLF